MYNEQKRLMEAAMKERIVRVRAERQAARDKLVEMLFTERQHDDEAENRRIEEIERQHYKRMDEAEERKAARVRKAQEGIDEYRKQHLAMIAQAKAREKQREVAELAALEADVKQYIEEERVLQEERVAEARKIFAELRGDIARHAKAKQAVKKVAVAERIDVEKQLDWEKEQFARYAAHQIESAKARGCTNIYPMQKRLAELEGFKPKAKPSLSAYDTRSAGNPFPGDTKKRMGFLQ